MSVPLLHQKKIKKQRYGDDNETDKGSEELQSGEHTPDEGQVGRDAQGAGGRGFRAVCGHGAWGEGAARSAAQVLPLLRAEDGEADCGSVCSCE